MSANTIISTGNKPSRVWKEIMDEYQKNREELENYMKKRDGLDVTIQHLPIIQYLDDPLLYLVRLGLISMLQKISEEQSCFVPHIRQKSALNGLDDLSEYLYNMNPRYPERQQNWTYIFDLDWVKSYLNDHPSRPYYPFSLLWTPEYATLKIQSFIRGYWVRRRPEVQEVRQFWKDFKASKSNAQSENDPFLQKNLNM